MKQQSCSMDHLIDQVNISEFDRETAKTQIHQAEAVVDAVAACISGVSKLLKPLTQWKFRTAHQH